jgi:pimeloyl-ACP methyl ester carboxylesterase
LPLPPQIQARYALPGPVVENYLVPLDNRGRIFRGSLSCGTERCSFRLIMPAQSTHEGPPPLLLCVPILAGGKSLMWYLASALANRGYAVAWAGRSGRALRRGQRGRDLEVLFRRTLLHNRMVLSWARRQPTLDSQRQGVFGVSMGGMVGTVLLALEPEVDAGVLCLAGGDLAGIIQHSTEDRIVRWRQWRQQQDGLGPFQVAREIEQELLTEPLRFGPYVPSHKVFLVATRLDQVVPMHNQDLLWESLGRPERLVMPLSHYSAVLGLGRILDSADRFLAARLGTPAQHTVAAAPSDSDLGPATGLPQEPR